MKLKRETREQARQGRYQLLEKKVEEDAEAYRHDTAVSRLLTRMHV